VPTNEQRRQAAKRKLERQLANRAARARRRRIFAVVGTVALVLLAVATIYWLASDNGTDAAAQQTESSSTTASAPAGQTTGGPCKYATTPDQPAAKPVESPADPDPTPKSGTVEMTFKTDQGDIPVTLDRAKAPCTVQSIAHLAEAKFYDGSPCHRIVHNDNFKVLQCGDPTGQGSGGPGYTIPDEKPTDLQPAPADASGSGASIYPRGAIAMAKTAQPNSGGSQFFMVYGSTFLPPEYTVFGTIGEPGLAVLDKIGAGGVDDSANPGSGDGPPKLATKITEVALAG
jgi:peptidyl-prolyl cis-trans isomerase B (cyclophilin B)